MSVGTLGITILHAPSVASLVEADLAWSDEHFTVSETGPSVSCFSELLFFSRQLQQSWPFNESQLPWGWACKVSLSGRCGCDETQGTLSLACSPLHISFWIQPPSPLLVMWQAPHCLSSFFLRNQGVFQVECFLFKNLIVFKHVFLCFSFHVSKQSESPLNLQMLLPHRHSYSWKSCSYEAVPLPSNLITSAIIYWTLLLS